MLNILEQSQPDPAGPLSAAELHTRIEAMKLAYADVKRYDGDPRFSKIPVSAASSQKQYAARRAALIDPNHADCDVAPGALPASDTTYLSVIDKGWQHPLALFRAITQPSAPASPCAAPGLPAARPRRTLQSRSAIARSLAGRKRPFHTIIPGFYAAWRPAHRLRHHGRNQPAPCPRAVRLQLRRLPHEYPGGALPPRASP